MYSSNTNKLPERKLHHCESHVMWCVKGGIGSLFRPLCNVMAEVATLTITHGGGQVIVALNCFSANSADFHRCAFTKQIKTQMHA